MWRRLQASLEATGPVTWAQWVFVLLCSPMWAGWLCLVFGAATGDFVVTLAAVLGAAGVMLSGLAVRSAFVLKDRRRPRDF